MGVKGLTTFINSNPLTKRYELHDCKVVVDGNNLLHFLYDLKKIDCICGGDYFSYAVEIENFLSTFKECSITPIIVLDGGLDKSDRFFRTKMERYKERFDTVQLASENGRFHDYASYMPLFCVEVFRSVLLKLKVTFAQCEYDSDSQIAALANYYDCPVISDDGDFYIYDIKNGFIKLSSIDTLIKTTTCDKRKKYLSCDLYQVDDFCHSYHIDKSMMPLFASLAGNDFLKYEDLRGFNFKIKKIPGMKCAKVLTWLKNYTVDEAIKQVLNCTNKKERKKLGELIEYSIETYQIKKSNLVGILDEKSSLFEDEVLSNTQLTFSCGAVFPKYFILAYNRGSIPSYFLDIVYLHRQMLSPQIENFSYQSSFYCSRFIREILLSVLLQHDSQNKRSHDENCLREVEEYGRKENQRTRIFRKPISHLPNEHPLPTLNEMEVMDKNEKIKFIEAVLGVENAFFQTIPSKLKLLFGCINYWIRNSCPKPAKEHLEALLICIIYFSILLKDNFISTEEENKDPDLAELLRKIERLSESKKSKENKYKQILDKYKQRQHFDDNNSFHISIVHGFTQFQTCLQGLISLNYILITPLESPKLQEIFEGSMLYNLTKDLLVGQNSSAKQLLEEASDFKKVFDTMSKIVFRNIPEDYAWEESANIVQNEVSNKYKRLRK